MTNADTAPQAATSPWISDLRIPEAFGFTAGMNHDRLCMLPSTPGAKLGHESCERLTIFVGRLLLQKVIAFDRHGLLVRPGAAEVPRATNEKASGVGVDKQFRD